MGQNITCKVDRNLVVTVTPPPGFDSSKPVKLFTHGFMSTTRGDKTVFVSAWMEYSSVDYSVILLEWKNLAAFPYDLAARNAIDVGEFTGRCLAELSNRYYIKSN